MTDSDIHKKLFDSSRAGDDNRVRELLAASANPDTYKDSYGDTALLEAARRGRDIICARSGLAGPATQCADAALSALLVSGVAWLSPHLSCQSPSSFESDQLC